MRTYSYFFGAVLLMVLATIPAHAGSAYMRVQSSNPARGLVYASGDTCVAPLNDSAYQKTYPANPPDGTLASANADASYCYFVVGTKTGPHPFYAWAKPARGYKFERWGKVTDIANRPENTDYGFAVSSPSDTLHRINVPEQQALWNGVADTIMGTAGASSSTYMTPQAIFSPADAYTVTYGKPVGGNYQVQYRYLETEPVTRSYGTSLLLKYYDDYQFVERTALYAMNDGMANKEVLSYEADSVTLSTDAPNFLGWYGNGVRISTANSMVYPVTADAAVQALFKTVQWDQPAGDLTMDKDALGIYTGTIYLPFAYMAGEWKASEFTVAPLTSDPAITIGTVQLDEPNNRLVIPYTYSPSSFGGVEMTVTVRPQYGDTAQFTIAAYTGEATAYEACLEENGFCTQTGSLTEMVALANTMSTRPVVRMMKSVAVDAPLSFLRSMTLDLNSHTLTVSSNAVLSVDAAGIEVQVTDGGFTHKGAVRLAYESSDNVFMARFTQPAKLSLHGGTLSAANSGTGGAYGIKVSEGSIFYMTDGHLTVKGGSYSCGVYVKTAGDYATINGGAVSVTAPSDSYGIYSAGQSNITGADIRVQTTSGGKAYGLYTDGGVATVTATAVAADAFTGYAFSAYVKVGRLNMNGGSLEAVALESDAYGVRIGSGATAVLQQNTSVAAQVTGENATNAYGIYSAGTARMTNISVSVASSATKAMALNTVSGAVSTVIDGGTYAAYAAQGSSYAVYHQSGKLEIEGAGLTATGKGDNVYGLRASADAALAHSIIRGETLGSASYAYGLVAEGKTKTHVSLDACTLTAQSAKGQAYALWSKAVLTAADCMFDAFAGSEEAYGVYVAGGTSSIVRCTADVTSYESKVCGIYHNGGSLTVEGGQYNVEAQQASAIVAENSNAHGVHVASGDTVTVDGASFYVNASNESASQNVYGAYVVGVLVSTNSEYHVSAKAGVFGIWGKAQSNLIMSHNIIRAEARSGSKCYGVNAKKDFTIDGDDVRAEGIATDVYALYFDALTSQGEVRDGRFTAIGNNTNDFGAVNNAGTPGSILLKGGKYSSNTGLSTYVAEGYNVFLIDNTEQAYADGFRHVIASACPSPYVCRIVNGEWYASLEEAFRYAKNHSGRYTIVLTQSYTMPAGDYELPANASLVIPYSPEHTYVMGAKPAMRHMPGMREEYIRLTMAEGAHLNVDGKMEVGGEMYCRQYGKTSFINSGYAQVMMEKDSRIQLNAGAYLYAWGYISGKGEITVKNNAEVHEMFQVDDMPTMSAIANYYLDNRCKYFPVQRYFVQNIEVPTTYYYNSRLICAMSNYYKGAVGSGYNYDVNIRVVGTSESLFLVDVNDESSWVRKSYDAEHDYQVWDVNSSAKLGSISITIDDEVIHSSNYILPITNNMRIHALDGEFTVTQSTQLLPGSSLEIDKTASLTVNKTFFDSRNYEQNLGVYVFDKDQWPWTQQYSAVFSPSWENGVAPVRTVGDAAMDIHGEITVKGGLFTSRKNEEDLLTDGANIYSANADAGTVQFADNAAADTVIILLPSGNDSLRITMESAKLKNGDDTYTLTAGTEAGETFIYMNGLWQKTYTEGCFQIIGGQAYAKPSEYVQLQKKEPEADHTYLTVTGKKLILMDECQWWEVEPTSDPDVFECKKEGYEGFYYYNTLSNAWEKKTVTVTFYAAEEGENIFKTLRVDYNAVPDQAIMASNPVKATTDSATYTFYGWRSSVEPYTVYPWNETLEIATADMAYRPVFTETVRNYTVIFKDAQNGRDVPFEMPYGVQPTCYPVKEPTAQHTFYFLHWVASDNETQYAADEELPTVTVDAVYSAVWARVVNTYSVVWKHGAETLETDIKQPYGAATSFDGEFPSKVTDEHFAYVFYGWTDTFTGETYANGATPVVTGATVYMANFTAVPRFTVTFVNYDGTVLQQSPVTQGERPVYTELTPARVRDLDGYYVFSGWKDSRGEFYAAVAPLPQTEAKETYTAQYDYTNDLFTVTLHDIDGAGGSWSGRFGIGAMPFYNPGNNDIPVLPAKAETEQYRYIFTGWSPTLAPVTGEASYTAQFEAQLKTYDVTFVNIDGNGAQTVVQTAYGAVPACPVAPVKTDDRYTYPFEGWDTELVAVTGPATYTATFGTTGTLRSFPVTFDTDNGDAPHVLYVQYGETPVWDGSTPVKEQNDAFTYTFSGWQPELAPVTGETVYTAQYAQTLRNYTVTFMDYNDTVLKSMQVAYGVIPVINTPVRTPDEEHKTAYLFAGWTPVVTPVAGDVVYTAQYSEVYYVASVTDAGGSTLYYSSWQEALDAANSSPGCTLRLHEDIDSYNNNIISAAMTFDLNGYTMSYINSSISKARLLYVTDSLVIEDSRGGGKLYYEGTDNASYQGVYVASDTASLTLNSGTIEVKKSGGTSSKMYAVPVFLNSGRAYIHGGELIAVSNQTAYAFYDYEYPVLVTGGYFKSQGRSDNYTKMFMGSDNITATGGYFSKDPGAITIPEGYEKRASDIEGYAYRIIGYYAVTFKDYNDTVMYRKTFAPGEQPVYAGQTPARERDLNGYYVFTGWMNSLGDFYADTVQLPVVTAHETYTAQYAYTIDHYTVTFKDYNDTVMYQQILLPGEQPVYAGRTPARERDLNGYYVFSGWMNSLGDFYADTVQLPEATAHETYTAQYAYTIDHYTVTFKDYNDTVMYQQILLPGEQPVYAGRTPARERDLNGYYVFTGWMNSLGDFYADTVQLPEATAHETYTAQYAYTVDRYTVTFLNWDSTVLQSRLEEAGSIPEYQGETPFRPDSKDTTYTFIGWSPAIETVLGEQTYIAQYSETAHTDPTGMEQTDSREPAHNARKVLLDGHIYILRGEEIHTVTGNKVK